MLINMVQKNIYED